MSEKRLFTQPITLQGSACFLSDAHFHVPENETSREREELLIRFLEKHREQIQHLFLLGDMFDFWFEYRDVVPKGYFRLFNTLYDLHQSGVEIYYFTGNHDMWVRDYFQQSFGCKVFKRPQAFVLNGKRCLVGHGDGLGGKQFGYRIIKAIFGFRPNQVLYSALHPHHAFSIARSCSQKSRRFHKPENLVFAREDEPQVRYARSVLESEPVDYFIFAHRHIPVTYKLTDTSTYINTGDWQDNFSYVMFTDQTPELLFYHKKQTETIG